MSENLKDFKAQKGLKDLGIGKSYAGKPDKQGFSEYIEGRKGIDVLGGADSRHLSGENLRKATRFMDNLEAARKAMQAKSVQRA